jgi:hypothetical protein
MHLSKASDCQETHRRADVPDRRCLGPDHQLLHFRHQIVHLGEDQFAPKDRLRNEVSGSFNQSDRQTVCAQGSPAQCETVGKWVLQSVTDRQTDRQTMHRVRFQGACLQAHLEQREGCLAVRRLFEVRKCPSQQEA